MKRGFLHAVFWLLASFFLTSCGGGSDDQPAVPAAPANVVVTPGTASLTVTWPAVPDATSYNVYWSNSSNVSPATGTLVSSSTNSATLTGLAAGTTYYVVVTAVNATGASAPSAVANAATPAIQPPANAPPTGVTALASDGQITISWIGVVGASSHTTYNIYWSTSPDVSPSNGTRIGGAGSPFVITGLANGTTYYAVVTATYVNGESGPSARVSATPAAASPVVFSAYAGNWAGSWHNNTFGSSGAASLAVTLDSTNTKMNWTITILGPVFGGSNPPAETFVGTVGPNSIALSGTSVTFGQLVLNIDSNGNITGSGTNLNNPNVSRIDFAGTWTAGGLNLTYTATLIPGGTATGTFQMNKQ